MAKKQQPGCCGCGSTCNVTIKVLGCNLAGVSGATVVLKQSGVTKFTGTTDGTGAVSFNTGTVQTYDITVTPPSARYNTKTSSGVSLSCGSTTNIALAAASGYVCVACCDTPIATTLYLTDACGTTTLTWDTINKWWAGGPITVSKSSTYQWVIHGLSGSCDLQTTGNVCVSYKFFCQTGTVPYTWQVERTWPLYQTSPGVYSYDSDPCGAITCKSGTDLAHAEPALFTPCAPFSWSGTLTYSNPNTTPGDPCSGTTSISE